MLLVLHTYTHAHTHLYEYMHLFEKLSTNLKTNLKTNLRTNFKQISLYLFEIRIAGHITFTPAMVTFCTQK